MTRAVAIIVAAGRGTRAGGDTPKQFRSLGHKPVIAWSADVLMQHADVRQVIIVVPQGELAQHGGLQMRCHTLIEGGATRSASVKAGLRAVSGGPDTPVLIHDAARPGLSPAMIDALLGALERADAAAPALPVADALKDTSTAQLKTVDRETLRRVQTPQAFRLGDIQAALSDDEQAFVDDLEAIEAHGKSVALVAGSARLGKITYEEDFALMTSILTLRGGAARMGTGYDVHRFGPGDHVTLCGVRIAHSHGLIGHSDADIGWHALTDAILGAVAMGDIGDHFPPSDPQWKDAESGKFLAHAAALAAEAGYEVSSVDITLICEAPKIKPHREAMRQRTAEILGLNVSCVSVKATTTEGLGFAGRAEGMAGQAAAVLTPLQDQG